MPEDGLKDKSLESLTWDAACSIRGAKDAPKYKEFILPLIFTKRLSDVFDDELNRIAKEVGSRAKAFKIYKIFAGRPRDLEDVRILALKNPAVDRAYVEKWLKQFDIALPKKRFLKTFHKVAGAEK